MSKKSKKTEKREILSISVKKDDKHTYVELIFERALLEGNVPIEDVLNALFVKLKPRHHHTSEMPN